MVAVDRVGAPPAWPWPRTGLDHADGDPVPA